MLKLASYCTLFGDRACYNGLSSVVYVPQFVAARAASLSALCNDSLLQLLYVKYFISSFS